MTIESIFGFCVFAICCPTLVFGARPMNTDDARVVDRHTCQLETWTTSHFSNTKEWYILPGCNMFLDIELSIGGVLAYNTSSISSNQAIFALKRVFADLERDGYSFGLAVGNLYNIRYTSASIRNEPYLYIPISFAFDDNTLLIHSNIGYKLEQIQQKPHIYTVGFGLEKQINHHIWLMGESFYERNDRAKFQLGLRIWLISNKLQMDMTYGNAFSGNQSFMSIGIRYLGDSLF